MAREAATRQLGTVPKLDVSAKAYLRDRAWPGNYNELQQVILGALANLRKNILTRDVLEKSTLPGAAPAVELRQYLTRLRDEYADAANILAGGDRATTASILGLSEEAMNRMFAPRDAAGS